MLDANRPDGQRQYAFRAIKSFGLVKACKDYQLLAVKGSESSIRHLAYDRPGKRVALASSDHIVVLDCDNGQEFFTVSNLANVFEVEFSLDGRWLSSWERPVSLPDGSPSRNLRVWDCSNGEQVMALSQRSQQRWNFQYHPELPIAVRMVTNEIQIYDASSADTFKSGIKQKLRVEGLTQFALSPGRNLSIAVFVGEKKGAPACIRIHQLMAQNNINGADVAGIIPSLHASAQKSFFKADKVELQWNAQGTALLVGTQTEVDKTGKSYYGETNLYLLAAAGNFDCRVTTDKEGPIHDVKWAPNGREFTVVYGFMPPKTAIFDSRANVLHAFPLGPRNMSLYNPQGRLLLIAGLGNLAGSCDVYDRSTLKQLCTIEASNSSTIEWSPDGRLLMTATMSPRLRVDNGIKIWHAATGTLIHEHAIDELYQVAWRSEPDSASAYPFKSILSPPPSPTLAARKTLSQKGGEGSTAGIATPTKATTGAYRPPHTRVAGYTRPVEYLREDQEGYVPPAPLTDENASGASGRKNRGIPGLTQQNSDKPNKKAGNKKTHANGNANGTASPTNGTGSREQTYPAVPVESSATSESDKRIRNIQKKLKSIAELKDKKQRGDPLEKTQVAKLETESALRKELESLMIT